MPDQRLGTWDKVVLVFSFCGACIFGVALWQENLVLQYFRKVVQGGQSIGEIVATKNDVRRRMNQSLTWYPAMNDERLFERDSVFTGPDSEIHLKIGDASALSVGADSLVVLQTKDNETILDLQLGSFSAVAMGGKFKVMQAGEVTEITGDKAAVPIHVTKNAAGQLKILSQTGNLEVQIKGQKTQLKKNEALSVEKNLELKRQIFPVKVTSHKLTEKAWTAAGEAIQLKWMNEAPELNLKLQVSKAKAFQEVLHTQEAPGTETGWTPTEQSGSFYYRFVDAASLEPVSMTYLLHLYERKPVALAYPPNKAWLHKEEVMAKGATKALRFQWEDKKGAFDYAFELAADPEFRNVVKTVETQVSRADVLIEQGTYYWRVKLGSLVSEPFQFTFGDQAPEAKAAAQPPTVVPSEPVAELPPPAPAEAAPAATPDSASKGDAPVVKVKAEKFALKFKDGVNARSPASISKGLVNPPKLKWEPLKGVKNYVVEISDEKDFKKAKATAVAGSEFLWRGAKPGTHYWRVKAKNGNGSLSAPSEAVEISIKMAPPKLKPMKLEDESTDQAEELNVAKSLTAKWSAVPLAAGYRVIAGEKNVIVAKNQFDFQLPPNQEMIVKIAAVDTKGNNISDFVSQKFKYERKLALTSPAIISPADNTTVVAFDATKMDPLLFAWKATPGVKEYELQFSTDKGFGKVLATKKMAVNNFVLKEKLSDKIVYWRVRALFDKNNSAWTKPRSYEIQMSDSK